MLGNRVRTLSTLSPLNKGKLSFLLVNFVYQVDTTDCQLYQMMDRFLLKYCNCLNSYFFILCRKDDLTLR